ncbi:MAG: DUF3089 domain-containing protein [Alphaproteobacteria bacterium]|nr:DUF3089 domain-containing protein [Alphaproteobacteria bacterium]
MHALHAIGALRPAIAGLLGLLGLLGLAALLAPWTAHAAGADMGKTMAERLATAGPAPEGDRVDYGDPASWLCRPGRKDACASDQTATVVGPGGSLAVESAERAKAPGVDCFYVYPSVSRGSAPNADLAAGPGQAHAADIQLARFAAVCRLFAPLYRQATASAYRSEEAIQAALALAMQDIRDAWHAYLAGDNRGRGVVLVGHSQGAAMLTELIKEEIDGGPGRDILVSALLGGQTVAVPDGEETGGEFRTLPLCREAGETGCIVAWASFLAEPAPPSDSKMIRDPAPGRHAACVNPAAPGGGPGPLKPYFLMEGPPGQGGRPFVYGPGLKTRYLSVPGILRAECVREGGTSYLAVSVDVAEAKARGLAGALTQTPASQTWYGLHTLDFPLTIGNLVDLVAAQAAAWTAAHPEVR